MVAVVVVLRNEGHGCLPGSLLCCADPGVVGRSLFFGTAIVRQPVMRVTTDIGVCGYRGQAMCAGVGGIGETSAAMLPIA